MRKHNPGIFIDSSSDSPSDYNYQPNQPNQSNQPNQPNSEKRKLLVPGICGFENMGNTCYMNAGLQALNVTHLSFYLRNNYFKTQLIDNIKKQINEKYKSANITDDILMKLCSYTVTAQLARITKAQWNTNSILVPSTLKKLVSQKNDEFKGMQQNDSQEFMNYIIDQIHEETKCQVKIEYCRNKFSNEVIDYMETKKKYLLIKHNNNFSEGEKKIFNNEWKKYKEEHINESIIISAYKYWKNYIEKNHSIITDIFTGLFCKRIEIPCGHKVHSFDPFTSLSIAIPEYGQTTLEECLKNFTSSEIVEYKCVKCNKVFENTKITEYIWESPETLVIHLKRFKTQYITDNYSRTEKINTNVKFPLENLNLKDNMIDLSIKDNISYNLCSVIFHSGVYQSGHYYSYCKNPINNEWYHFNDTFVDNIPKDDVNNQIDTRDAYVLIYQKNRKVD